MSQSLSRKEKPGRALERLVHAIEAAVSHAEDVDVQSPQKLIDRDTNRRREFDVVVSISRGHHNLTVAIECRDRRRKIGVDQVEAYHKKCQACGISHGVIVSSVGFHQSALTKAKVLGISCMMLDEVDQFDWCQTSSVSHRIENIKHVNIVVFPVEEPNEKWVLVSEDGDVSDQQMQALARYCLHQIPQEVRNSWPTGTAVPLEFRGPSTGYSIRLASGRTIPVSEIAVRIIAMIDQKLTPIQFHRYTATDASGTQTEAATALVQHGAAQFRIVIHGSPDGSKRVVIVPQPAEAP